MTPPIMTSHHTQNTQRFINNALKMWMQKFAFGLDTYQVGMLFMALSLSIWIALAFSLCM
jgi:hypothetical protein